MTIDDFFSLFLNQKFNFSRHSSSQSCGKTTFQCKNGIRLWILQIQFDVWKKPNKSSRKYSKRWKSFDKETNVRRRHTRQKKQRTNGKCRREERATKRRISFTNKLNTLFIQKRLIFISIEWRTFGVRVSDEHDKRISRSSLLHTNTAQCTHREKKKRKGKKNHPFYVDLMCVKRVNGNAWATEWIEHACTIYSVFSIFVFALFIVRWFFEPSLCLNEKLNSLLTRHGDVNACARANAIRSTSTSLSRFLSKQILIFALRIMNKRNTNENWLFRCVNTRQNVSTNED